MAIIYYPKSSYMYQKDTVSASYENLVLSVNPNTILYFDTASGINAISASTIMITSSWAVSASWVGGNLAGARGKTIVLCSGFTPTQVGPDYTEVMVPYMNDGVNVVTWSIKRLNFRAGISGSYSASVTFENSTSTGSFSASAVQTLVLPANTYEVYTSSFGGSLGTIYSGNKMRFNVDYIGDAEYWTITAEIDG